MLSSYTSLRLVHWPPTKPQTKGTTKLLFGQGKSIYSAIRRVVNQLDAPCSNQKHIVNSETSDHKEFASAEKSLARGPQLIHAYTEISIKTVQEVHCLNK